MDETHRTERVVSMLMDDIGGCLSREEFYEYLKLLRQMRELPHIQFPAEHLAAFARGLSPGSFDQWLASIEKSWYDAQWEYARDMQKFLFPPKLLQSPARDSSRVIETHPKPVTEHILPPQPDLPELSIHVRVSDLYWRLYCRYIYWRNRPTQ